MAAPPATTSVHSTCELEPPPGCVDDAACGVDDLRPNPVTGDGHDPIGRKVGLRQGRPRSVRWFANATATPLISAPWSLLTATR